MKGIERNRGCTAICSCNRSILFAPEALGVKPLLHCFDQPALNEGM